MFDLRIVGFGAKSRILVASVPGESDTVRFLACSASNPDKIMPFCEEHSLRNGDIFNGVEGVVIAGHAASHATYAMDAVNAGKSALTIKPLATTSPIRNRCAPRLRKKACWRRWTPWRKT